MTYYTPGESTPSPPGRPVSTSVEQHVIGAYLRAIGTLVIAGVLSSLPLLYLDLTPETLLEMMNYGRFGAQSPEHIVGVIYHFDVDAPPLVQIGQHLEAVATSPTVVATVTLLSALTLTVVAYEH